LENYGCMFPSPERMNHRQGRLRAKYCAQIRCSIATAISMRGKRRFDSWRSC
jgi:hypothetical protein